MSVLRSRFEALSTAVDVAGASLSPGVADDVHDLGRRIDGRAGLDTDLTAVAIAGPTGSGKSSLFNAITGLELAATGVQRPTTLTTTACVYGDGEAGELLDWLGIAATRRVPHRSLLDDAADDVAGLVLLDLPDHDSVVLAHRDEVDRLVTRADVLVWVTDPVKYADAALHVDYLRRLSAHDEVVVVVLNRVDELSDGDCDRVLVDLRALLDADGIGDVPVFATSARSGLGVDELTAHLLRVAGRREAALVRLAADTALLAQRVRDELDLPVSSPAEPTARPEPTPVGPPTAPDTTTALDEAAQDRRARWAVLGLALTAVLIGVVLGVLLLAGVAVPGGMWVIPAAAGAAAATGWLLLRAREDRRAREAVPRVPASTPTTPVPAVTKPVDDRDRGQRGYDVEQVRRALDAATS